MTTLKRTMKRVIVPEDGKPFIVTLTPDGILSVRKYRRRKGSERVCDLRDMLDNQIKMKGVI